MNTIASTQHKACLICGGPSLKELSSYTKNYLTQCTDCGFVFCYKIPGPEELQAYYEQYPRGGGISAITIKRYHELLDKFEKYRKTNNIVDIGCGDGFFLATAKERGWNVYGTEFTDRALAVCKEKGIEMKTDPSEFPANFFDIVTSFEVIEHINNPTKELRKFDRILRTGGYIYITTPNFNSLSRIILKQNWNVIQYPEHLSYYSPQTLAKLLTRLNFKVERNITTGFSFTRYQRSTGQANSNSDEVIREKAEKSFWLNLIKNSVNFLLRITNKGDSIKATFQKKSAP